MIERLKNKKYQIIEMGIIFLITLLFTLMCKTISNDEIWTYGFSYNISTGLIPYKDFNIVITPLFPVLGAIVLNLFGKNLLVFHIFNSFICTLIFCFMKKNTKKSYYIIYTIFLFFSLPNYNIFCILLLYILMAMEDKKSNDYLIGLILGLTFLTKQNIGIYLCIPTLFTKDIRKIIKRIIGFIIPNVIFLIYLIYINSLYEFIDYTFLGISEFAKENLLIRPSCLIILAISYLYIIYKYTKIKDMKLIYLFCFQLLAFPLIEPYHLMIAIIPTFGYFINTLKLNKKIITITFIIFVGTIFLVNTYDIYKNKYTFPNNTNKFKYRKISHNEDIIISDITNYMNNIEDELYVISGMAYLLKLEANIKINKYDLLNNGNLGKNGSRKIINEIKNTCNIKKCTFLIDTNELKESKEMQYNKDIINFILKNYEETGQIKDYKIIIYRNY